MRSAPTEAEAAMWRLLRARRLAGWKWRRQQPIGRYIVDFVCFDARLIVEVDGSQHAGSAYDAVRDNWFTAQGFRLLRFWNNDVLARPEAVLAAIHHALSGEGGGALAPPLPCPSPARGEGFQNTASLLLDERR